MKILKVIHGYPPHFMAGSEVYTANLVRELAKNSTVAVFTGVENLFDEPYRVTDSREGDVLVRRINKPRRDYTFKDKYLDSRVDEAFRQMMRDFQPDVVHVGHLSHLSTNLVAIARQEFRVPVVFTIHDFWMFCFRGQLVEPRFGPCSGPSVAKCFECAKHSFKDWMTEREIVEYRDHMARVIDLVDLFLAPSRTVERFFLEQGVPRGKVVFSPYGFETGRIGSREPRAQADRSVRFGFLGRVIPVKGVALLVRAFRKVTGAATLTIHGELNGQRSFIEELRAGDARVALAGPYRNEDVGTVLADLDVVVVPSIWRENSPLVIQEAQLAGLPVVASDAGGMAELVEHGKNGYLFPLGDEEALARTLQEIVDRPEHLETLEVDAARVRGIEDDARACLEHYRALCSPRRLTIVTNPGLCNMSCTMCDTHSVYGKSKLELKALPILSWEAVEKNVRELARLGLREVIPSTMGEPLMYPQFEKLVELIRQLGLTLNLTTNGSFPRASVAQWAKMLMPVLSDMKVSLNGTTAEVNEAIMRGADTAQQMRNVEEFLSHRDRSAASGGPRPSVTIQATFMETGLPGLPDLLRWAIARGVDRFKGHHVWVTWPQLESESLRRSPEAAERWNSMVAVLTAITDAERGPSGRRIRLENVVRLEPERAGGPPEDSECPFLGKEAWLEADGSFQVCCCPAELRKDFGDFGNVADTSFSRLWASPTYRSFVGRWGDHPNCQSCNMRRPRGGATRG
jgi:glycosyltransferase involved in cell wall biosynthesis/MoaA/NifB/PqqE/SkfB family radical SAM enzyme